MKIYVYSLRLLLVVCSAAVMVIAKLIVDEICSCGDEFLASIALILVYMVASFISCAIISLGFDDEIYRAK